MTEEEQRLRQENQELRDYLGLLKTNNFRIKERLAVYVWENQLEQETLKSRIRSIQEQIVKLKVDVASYEPTKEGNDLEIDDNGEIRGGTVEKLIDCLYFDHGTKVTMEYVKVFLLTYRSFTRPADVLEHLRKCYQKFVTDSSNIEAWKPARLRIGNFLRKWITDNFFEFVNDQDLQEKYDSFASFMEKTDGKLSASIKGTLSKTRAAKPTYRPPSVFNTQAPQPHKPKSATITTVLDIHPQELARQITLIEYDACRSIQPKECLGMAWAKPGKEEKSPNLLAMIRRFNGLSGWIAYLLVSEPNPKRRSQLIAFVVDLLQYLQELNNFNAIFAVVSGLGNSAVFRLKKTFATLNTTKQKTLDDIRTLTNPEKSWANYRTKIHSINPPCVPFLGVYQTDLTFIEEGNKDKLANGFINWKKCRLTAGVITEIQQYQTVPYNLVAVAPVQQFYISALAEMETLGVDDKKLYDLSLVAEPRDPQQ